MTAPTAAGLLKLLDKRRTMAALNALGDMDDAHHEALRRSLAAVPAKSRIDVPVLLDSVRCEVAASARAELEKRKASADAGRYERLLISQGYVPRFGKVSASAGIARAVEPDPDPDEDRKPAPRKRSILRHRPRPQSTEDRSGDASAEVAAPRRRERISGDLSRSEGRMMGPRAFDQSGSLTPEPVEFVVPPWIIDDGEETDDGIETRRRRAAA